MISSVENKDRQIKPSIEARVGGFAAGYVVYSVTPFVVNAILSRSLARKIPKSSFSASNSDEFKAAEKFIETILTDTGLDKKGVGVLRVDKISLEEFHKAYPQICEKSPIQKFVMVPIRRFLGMPSGASNNDIAKWYKIIADGKDGFFYRHINKIVLSDKAILIASHEIGHAANYNLNKFTKILQSCKNARLLTVVPLLAVLLKTKKQEGEKPQGVWDKTTTFIKENAGKLTLLACLPLFTEEILASLWGNKFAKKALSPELAKKVFKVNAMSMTAKTLHLVVPILAVYLAGKTKDAITDGSVAKKQLAQLRQANA